MSVPDASRRRVPPHSDPAVPWSDRREEFLDLLCAEQPHVVAFLLRLGVPLADAQDATQEAFIHGWGLAKTSGWSVVREPRGWIRRVALRSLGRPNGRRRHDREVLTAEVPESGCSDGGQELTVATLATRSILRALPRDEGIALALKMDGFTAQETGEILDVTPERARYLLKKARRRLQRDLATETTPEVGTS